MAAWRHLGAALDARLSPVARVDVWPASNGTLQEKAVFQVRLLLTLVAFEHASKGSLASAAASVIPLPTSLQNCRSLASVGADVVREGAANYPGMSMPPWHVWLQVTLLTLKHLASANSPATSASCPVTMLATRLRQNDHHSECCLWHGLVNSFSEIAGLLQLLAALQPAASRRVHSDSDLQALEQTASALALQLEVGSLSEVV